MHVITGGGSFGRKLFCDAAIEAAEISKAMGKPVKLMWHRADEPRQGRVHPMAHLARCAATVLGGQVLAFEQRHTSVETDFSHGLGEMLTATGRRAARRLGNLGFAQTVFQLTPGAALQLRRRHAAAQRDRQPVQHRQHAQHLLARRPHRRGADHRPARRERWARTRCEFRREFLRDERVARRARRGRRGRQLGSRDAGGHRAGHRDPQGVQGRSRVPGRDRLPARRPSNRKVRDGVTGPRVTKVVFAVDVGLAVNPHGLEAQMMGGVMDGIALALTCSLHLRDGHFLEASWDNYFYTRQWNIPPEVRGHRHAADDRASPAVPASSASRPRWPRSPAPTRGPPASMPTTFPINHGDPLALRGQAATSRRSRSRRPTASSRPY